MIFDTIYEFYFALFYSPGLPSAFWELGGFELGDGTFITWVDYLCTIGTIATIICGIFALFRILGGILRLFKV